jgi:undecaprenyl diphosphate synthase
MEVVEDITEACRNLGVKFLTLYAFSDENWERPPDEVAALMRLLVSFLRSKKQKLITNQIRFKVIGDRQRLPGQVLEAIDDVETATTVLSGMTLLVALSYGSRTEICRAVQRAVESGAKDITPEEISGNLDTVGIPDPDLLIRTSGEKRISNFLLWQIAYSELYFTDKHWPDFTGADLEVAIEDYRRRERRFGKTSEQI